MILEKEYQKLRITYQEQILADQANIRPAAGIEAAPFATQSSTSPPRHRGPHDVIVYVITPK